MPHTANSLQEAFKYLWPDEVQALKVLAQMLPDNPIVVNIGAGAGTSGLAFLEARSDLHLITVDIRQEDSPLGCLSAEQAVILEAGLAGRNEQYCMSSVKLGQVWLPIYDKPLVDMVFIDGEHSYEGCKGDILSWLPNIKPGGIIAVHDYDKGKAYEKPHGDNVPHPKPWPGVDQAVKELLLDKYDIILHIDTLISFMVGEE